MNYSNQILFFFGAIGVFNCLIIAFYFLISKSYSNISNKLFGFFILLLSLRVIKSLFYAFSTEDPIWFLQFGTSFFLLIGPLFFSYLLSVLKPISFWAKYWKYHILFWLIIIVLLTKLIPFKENNEINKTIILPIINFQWLIYILVSGLSLKLNYKNLKHNSSKTIWLIVLIFAVLIIWTSYAFIIFQYFITGSIIFSILFYIFFLFFIFNKKSTSLIFQKVKKSTISKITNDVSKLVVELKGLMKTRKIYTNPNLKLPDVANNLNITTHELSRLLNEDIGDNFTDFINKYRIEEAKKLIKTNSKYTIEAIGVESGFNSKSAFYKAFKKFTDLTPAKYKSQL